ncbi:MULTISPECIES: hypothetical protein [Hymenobacter]|uniref:Uncharacterized protein n=2 Tax=Hymenobacter TaxID=89966 RepID=W8EUN8_9BACT|nr:MULTISPECIES: hypothetical protein [Hymenobacter]AHJ95447.1 hypothetical protein Hsw_PA0114 [Hymenobacter swuensis DY53]WBA43997.1 hypothetical protein O3303_20750 [Hymenobacter canadensis]
MKQLLFVWMCLAWCWDAVAQSAGPLPLRPAFINVNAAAHGLPGYDTVARPGVQQIPGRLAYVGPYRVWVSGAGEVATHAVADRNAPHFVYSPSSAFGFADFARCSSVHGNKLVFVSITDGYLQPRRYRVVEMSLDRQAVVRHYRSRLPVCATYSADGTHIVVEAQGRQQRVPSAY